MLDVLLEIPLAPKSKNKVRTAVKSGRVIVFRDKGDRSWAQAFAEIASSYLPKEIIDEPVRVDILAVLPRPATLMRKRDPDGLVWHGKRPDEENLRKAVKDALKSFWRDDSLVCFGTTIKVCAEKTGRPRTVVRIRSVTGWDADESARELGLLAIARKAVSG